MVVPGASPTLICTIWTTKLYNLESFRAQMKSIWKTRKKFEIQMAGQNLFQIVFDLKEDLDTVMERRPWLFRKNLILFDRLTKHIEMNQLRLNSSPFWIKIGSCLSKFDKKNLLHAIGVTFEEVIRSEIIGDSCRLRINLNVQQPLRRGIFVSIDNINKSWISFKYEKLPIFCFGCGIMRHDFKGCLQLSPFLTKQLRRFCIFLW